MDRWDPGLVTIATGAATIATVIIAAASVALVIVTQTDSQHEEKGADIPELRWDLRADIAELRADIRGLAERIDGFGMRVTQVELDQARLDATNEILLQQSHTHPDE